MHLFIMLKAALHLCVHRFHVLKSGFTSFYYFLFVLCLFYLLSWPLSSFLLSSSTFGLGPFFSPFPF